MLSTCTVVLGMHRSGTSLVANVLNTLGVYMGTKFREPDVHNPSGYWEDMDWRELNKFILKRLDATWYDPPITARVYSYIDTGSIDAVVEMIATLVDARAEYPSWGFKDPRTAITIPIISLGLPENTQYIFIRRNEDAVVDSLIRRAESRGYYESPLHWRVLYRDYNERIIAFLHTNHSRFITVTYEQLVHPEQSRFTVRSIADFVGVRDKCQIKSACGLVKFR